PLSGLLGPEPEPGRRHHVVGKHPIPALGERHAIHREADDGLPTTGWRVPPARPERQATGPILSAAVASFGPDSARTLAGCPGSERPRSRAWHRKRTRRRRGDPRVVPRARH